MPHNGFIYEASMDMMENSGHCFRAAAEKLIKPSPVASETGFAEEDAKANIINVNPDNILLRLIMTGR